MLESKRMFVSGGTGHIGAAICRRAARYGAEVYFSYCSNEERAAELESEIENCRGIRINLKDLDEVQQRINQLHRDSGTFDLLVNNAGVSQVMPFAMLEEEDFDLMMDVNVKGTFFLTKAFVRGMVKNRAGAIVNIGSIAGHRMLEVPVHYATSKAAIWGFTTSLAIELQRFNIRVNSVVPGLIEGGISRNIPEDLREDFNSHCAAGRPGRGEEVAELVCFLGSEKASYVNGQNVCVDGGI